LAQHDDSQDLRTINLRLSAELVERIDQLKGEFGLRSRGAIVERLLSHLFTDPDLDGEDDLISESLIAEEPSSDLSTTADPTPPEPVPVEGGPDGQRRRRRGRGSLDAAVKQSNDPAAADPAVGDFQAGAVGEPGERAAAPSPELEQLALDPAALQQGTPPGQGTEPAVVQIAAADSAGAVAGAVESPSAAATTPASAAPVQDGSAEGASTVRAAAAAAGETPGLEPQPPSSGCFDESSALVLVAREGSMELVLDLDLPGGGRVFSSAARGRAAGGATAASGQAGRTQVHGRGIDLPGFVRRRSDQLRQSLHPRRSATATPSDPLPTVAADRLEQVLGRAFGHWMELYGSEPNEAVLEASMIWLAQDIWPQSDQSEGRPFSWSLVQQVMTDLCPAWPQAPATFGRVMVAAGILEDPFSVSTLELRIPTLIRRFVHRFRRRRPGASFQTLEHTMTLHGALRLLQLPTTPGQRLTLPQIREAYREMALAHHPDAGGSEDAMRRLNEAYQLLKELYRTA
jgi:hypothetical protein